MVHTGYLDDDGKPREAIRPNSERTDECAATDQAHRTLIHHTSNTRPRSTPYWRRTRVPIEQVLIGAAAFLNDRAHRFTVVHTGYLDEGKPREAVRPNSERTDECAATDQAHRTSIHHTSNTHPRSTPYWRESDFVAGHVSSKHAY